MSINIILSDTRQQAGRHKLKEQYFKSQGIMVNRTKLYCGDYTLPTNQSICVDTKKDIQELIGDIHVKVMPKKEVEERVREIFIKCDITSILPRDIYGAICDDDNNRFAENEISMLCQTGNIHGYLYLCKIMKKKGKTKECVKEFYLNENSTEEILNLCLEQYKIVNQGEFSITREKVLIENEFLRLYLKRHGFFHRGLKRAQNNNIQLVVLVENTNGIACIEDLFKWVNPRSQIFINDKSKIIGYWGNGNPRYARIQQFPNATKGQTLAKALLTMQSKYGVKFKFCTPEEAGKRVLEILQGDV